MMYVLVVVKSLYLPYSLSFFNYCLNIVSPYIFIEKMSLCFVRHIGDKRVSGGRI